MSKKFVRNITNTRIKGAIQEPLNTNVQNDLLSDGEDVAVRNKDEYHLLTDNVKSITSGNDGIKVKVTGKNSRELVAKIVELTSETDEVNITNPETNVFTIDIDFSGYTDKTLFESEILRLENDIENVEIDLSDYVTLDDFSKHVKTTNNPHKVTKAQVGLAKVENRESGDIDNITLITSISMYKKRSLFTKVEVSGANSNFTLDFGNENNKQTEFLNVIFITNPTSIEKTINLQNDESVHYEDIPTTIKPNEILMIKYVYFWDESTDWKEQVILEIKFLNRSIA